MRLHRATNGLGDLKDVCVHMHALRASYKRVAIISSHTWCRCSCRCCPFCPLTFLDGDSDESSPLLSLGIEVLAVAIGVFAVTVAVAAATADSTGI